MSMPKLFTNCDPYLVADLLTYETYDDKDALGYQVEQFTTFGEKKYLHTIIEMFKYNFDRLHAIKYVGNLVFNIHNPQRFINQINYVSVLSKLSARLKVAQLLPDLEIIDPLLFDCCTKELAKKSAPYYSREMAYTAVNTCLHYGNQNNLLTIIDFQYFREAIFTQRALMYINDHCMIELAEIVAPKFREILSYIVPKHIEIKQVFDFALNNTEKEQKEQEDQE